MRACDVASVMRELWSRSVLEFVQPIHSKDSKDLDKVLLTLWFMSGYILDGRYSSDVWKLYLKYKAGSLIFFLSMLIVADRKSVV